MKNDTLRYITKSHVQRPHNPNIGKLTVETGFIEMIMFNINPAFDMRPPT